MMKRYRAHFYKLTTITLLTLALISCGKESPVKFCEGVSPEGSGVNCGTVFSPGDMTVLFESDTPFETDILTLKIAEKEDGKEIPLSATRIEVTPEEKSGESTIGLYRAGTFLVQIEKAGSVIAEGTITIEDQQFN